MGAEEDEDENDHEDENENDHEDRRLRLIQRQDETRRDESSSEDGNLSYYSLSAAADNGEEHASELSCLPLAALLLLLLLLRFIPACFRSIFLLLLQFGTAPTSTRRPVVV